MILGTLILVFASVFSGMMGTGYGLWLMGRTFTTKQSIFNIVIVSLCWGLCITLAVAAMMYWGAFSGPL